MSNVNEGHRQRLRQRMLNEGLAGFQDHEILEMYLFRLLPRRDTNKLAHELIRAFGSLSNVFDATPQQLMTIKGISEVTACAIAMEKELWRRFKSDEAQKISLASISSVMMYAQKLMEENYVEKLVAVYVDNATNFIFSEEFSSDNRFGVSVDLKRIVSSAMRCNAAGVILFHCHVKGVCQPSDADVAFTEKLFVTLANINLVLLDHVIFNNTDNYYSFFKEGKMEEFSKKYGKKAD